MDIYAEKPDFVSRNQGGNNAGHTVINRYGKFALHLLPSGVFNRDVTNIIGNGAVVNVEALVEELGTIEKAVNHRVNLMVSERSHVIFPFHILLDSYEEERLSDRKFGSTKKGIAPVYSDKYLKIGILAGDLLNKDYLRERLKSNLDIKNQIIRKIYNKPEVDLDEMVEWGHKYGELLKEYIGNPIPVLKKALTEDREILLEGQLGALRDIEFGIYPYTTSSSPNPGFASSGCFIPPYSIRRIIGVMKSYSTCVGEGPFCTELFDETADRIREKGREFGASTGRPRRIGWFDAVASRYGCDITHSTEVALTLLDVLSGQNELKICTGYNIDGKILNDFPTTQYLSRVKPEYLSMPGWNEDITGIKNFDDLPENARNYVLKIEELTGVAIKYISVGPERDQLITR